MERKAVAILVLTAMCCGCYEVVPGSAEERSGVYVLNRLSGQLAFGRTYYAEDNDQAPLVVCTGQVLVERGEKWVVVDKP